MHPHDKHINVKKAIELYSFLQEWVRNEARAVYLEKNNTPSTSEHYTSENSLSSPILPGKNANCEVEFLLRDDQNKIHTEKLKVFVNFFIDNKGFSENHEQLKKVFTNSIENEEKKKWREDDYLLIYLMDKFWKKVIYYDKGLYQMLIDKFKDQNGNEFEYNRLKSLLNKYKTKVARYRPSTKTDKKPEIIYWDEKAEKLLSFLLPKT